MEDGGFSGVWTDEMQTPDENLLFENAWRVVKKFGFDYADMFAKSRK